MTHPVFGVHEENVEYVTRYGVYAVIPDEKKENIILTVSDIKFSKFVKKIFKTDIKNFKNSNKILVIGRKKWQTEIKMT